MVLMIIFIFFFSVRFCPSVYIREQNSLEHLTHVRKGRKETMLTMRKKEKEKNTTSTTTPPTQ